MNWEVASGSNGIGKNDTQSNVKLGREAFVGLLRAERSGVYIRETFSLVFHGWRR